MAKIEQRGDPPIKIFVQKDDLNRWQSAINYYTLASKKSLEEVILVKSREVLYYLSSHVKAEVGTEPSSMIGYRLADGSLDSLKLTAWLLRKRAEAGKIKGYGEKVPDGQKGAGKKVGRVLREWKTKKGEGRKRVELLHRGEFYTRDYARQFAKKHSNTRWGHRQFIYVLPFKTAQALIEKADAKGIPSKGRKPVNPSARKKLVPVSTTVSIKKDSLGASKSQVLVRGSYSYKSADTLAEQPTDARVEKLNRIYARNIKKALNDSTRNMSEYIARKLKKLWDRHQYHNPAHPTDY